MHLFHLYSEVKHFVKLFSKGGM
uniref:Uncharacterized protein n=1 Tax=Anguilla anguilla TaxID=7936 RepID=A0A0E9TPW6_ANGAN